MENIILLPITIGGIMKGHATLQSDVNAVPNVTCVGIRTSCTPEEEQIIIDTIKATLKELGATSMTYVRIRFNTRYWALYQRSGFIETAIDEHYCLMTSTL